MIKLSKTPPQPEETAFSVVRTPKGYWKRSSVFLAIVGTLIVGGIAGFLAGFYVEMKEAMNFSYQLELNQNALEITNEVISKQSSAYEQCENRYGLLEHVLSDECIRSQTCVADAVLESQQLKGKQSLLRDQIEELMKRLSSIFGPPSPDVMTH